MSPPFTNRLAGETSPYLRQHAHNPVAWYPWSPEAFARARELNRPIFLSIGYSACHWCHVMEHESFEDPEVARVLNDHFVSIKVDREERPDVDQIYMSALQLMSREGGGWPLSMFLTPDGKPFYGGTYFPPDDRYGRPSFKRLLQHLADAWENRRDEVVESSGQITEQLRSTGQIEESPGDLDLGVLRTALTHLGRGFDHSYGGFGHAPKFPHATEMRFLLRAWKRFDDDDALQMARLTLDRMSQGGLYDQLGGGFHRYSTDQRWLVPHFEKMLYDNALLAAAYLEAFQATKAPAYREVVEETLGYVLREMTSPEGPFFSTQDADSEGVEGKFYVWSASEIETVLGPELADLFGEAYGVSTEGNWEEHNILHRARPLEQVARLRGLEETGVRARLAEARRKLFAIRSRRIWPGRDEKVLTSWNGLMINALARAARPLETPAYAEAAARAADFLLTRMRGPGGRLFRTWSAGSDPKLNAYLEDYAFLIDALVSLYEATFALRWIEAALELAGVLIDQFWDPAEGGFFFTGRDHEPLITRTKDLHDGSTPSGNSIAATALLRLAKLTGRADLFDKAQATLRLFGGSMRTSPMAVGQMLIALDFSLGPVHELAVVGRPEAADTREVLRTIFAAFRPHQVVAFKPAGDDSGDRVLPLLEGKAAADGVNTYICQNFACQAPLIGAEPVKLALS